MITLHSHATAVKTRKISSHSNLDSNSTHYQSTSPPLTAVLQPLHHIGSNVLCCRRRCLCCSYCCRLSATAGLCGGPGALTAARQQRSLQACRKGGHSGGSAAQQRRLASSVGQQRSEG